MSSHREAPEISKDPAADNTDVYAFVDAADPTKVNLIANFNPFEIPYGGPNFSEFADDVLYTINVSNGGQSEADISYEFRFTTTIRNPNTFLYNTFPITSFDDPVYNRPQTYTVTKVVRAPSDGTLTSTVIGTGLKVPPCNVGERSTPNYEATLGAAGVQSLTTAGGKVFAGPRSDPFFVDLGSIFDLGGIRGANQAHILALPVVAAMNGLQGLNCHTIALQVPITELSKTGTAPTDVTSPNSVIGVWSSTYRTRGRLFDSATGKYKSFGEPVQVSRLGNPLFNEVVNPMAEKDYWNAVPPKADSAYAKNLKKPELAVLLPILYPSLFPKLGAFNNATTYRDRADLDAILLTGIPASVLGGAFTTLTGPVKADMLRLNLAQPPKATAMEKKFGILDGDLSGFPNGRRLRDDVTGIELQAIAGATIPLVYPDYVPDAAASGLADGTTNTNPPLLSVFPYVGTPNSGYSEKPPTPAAGGDPAPRGTATTSAATAAAPAAAAPLATATAPGKAKAKKKHGTKKATKKRAGKATSRTASNR